MVNSVQVGDRPARTRGAAVAVPSLPTAPRACSPAHADRRQSTGQRLNTGFGSETVVCTGTDRALGVTGLCEAFPYKRGRANVIRGGTAADRVTFQSFDTAVGRLALRIPKYEAGWRSPMPQGVPPVIRHTITRMPV
jgi:hypothetical protein